MISQENIYHLIFHGHWTAIINILYRHKEDISDDPSLNHAAITFEREFFNKVADYPNTDIEINANLDKLYLLHHGKFYKLKVENYKKLIIELVKRKQLQEAYNYAQIFPNEEVSIEVIRKIEKRDVNPVMSMSQYNATSLSDKTWIEIYNRLFELINEKENTAVYFTGPKFINTVREFLPYHPTYEQYIELRNREGKSTSRRIFYYDILFEQNEHTRRNIIERILELVRPFEKAKTEKIEELLGLRIENRKVVDDQPQSDDKQNPVVFISYSWDNEEHKSWVLNLAKALQSKGVVVILNQYELRLKPYPY